VRRGLLIRIGALTGVEETPDAGCAGGPNQAAVRKGRAKEGGVPGRQHGRRGFQEEKHR